MNALQMQQPFVRANLRNPTATMKLLPTLALASDLVSASPVAETSGEPAMRKQALQSFYRAALQYATEGDRARARNGFNMALQLDPTLPVVHFGLGHLAEEEGVWIEAVQRYEEVERLAPGSPLARAAKVHLDYARERRKSAAG